MLSGPMNFQFHVIVFIFRFFSLSLFSIFLLSLLFAGFLCFVKSILFCDDESSAKVEKRKKKEMKKRKQNETRYRRIQIESIEHCLFACAIRFPYILLLFSALPQQRIKIQVMTQFGVSDDLTRPIFACSAIFVHFQIANGESQCEKSDLRQKQVKMILCAMFNCLSTMFEELISESEALWRFPSALFVPRFVWSHDMAKRAPKMNVYGDSMKSLVGKKEAEFLTIFLLSMWIQTDYSVRCPHFYINNNKRSVVCSFWFTFIVLIESQEQQRSEKKSEHISIKDNSCAQTQISD